MPTKKPKTAKKISITIRLHKDSFKYLEKERKGLRDRTGQIEHFIAFHKLAPTKS